jgi:hypothetical protein
LFDKFDPTKVGSGVGQQLFGKGTYFAESPAVAKEYAKINPSGANPSPSRMLLGKDVAFGSPEYKAAQLVDELGVSKAKKFADEWDKAYLLKLQNDWDSANLTILLNSNDPGFNSQSPDIKQYRDETEEEKIARIGNRPTSYASTDIY